MKPCARCDWRPDPTSEQPARDQLAEHADQAGHPLCVVCRRSLSTAETQTCEARPEETKPGQPVRPGCLDRAYTHLAGVRLMVDELPSHLGQTRGRALTSDRPAADDGRPLLGGEILVLLGPGNEGLREDGVTSRDGDTRPLAYELDWWEQEWRAARGERVTGVRPASTGRVIRDALGYLETRMRWAATSFGGFGDFARDLRALHTRLERITGRTEPVVRAEAECFACGADELVREIQAGRRCKHEPPAFPKPWPGPVPCPISARRAEFAAAVEAYEQAHGRCQQGGYVDHWTCQRCGERYDWQRYVLACAARVETGRETLRTVGWGTPVQVAAAVGVPVETVRTWAKRGQVTTCCLVSSQEQVVWYPDAEQRAARRRQRTASRCA